MRQDVKRLQSVADEEERVVETSTGTTSKADLEKLVQKSKILHQLEVQRNKLEALRRQEMEEIQGVQVRAQTANTEFSRTLDRLDAACIQTKQKAAGQNVTLRRAKDAIKLLELEQNGLKGALREVIPGAQKVKKVKDALAVLTRDRRQQWTRLVGLQEKLRQTRRISVQTQKLSVHASQMQQLRAEVSTIQRRNKALQAKLKSAATEILVLHEQQAQLIEGGVAEDAEAATSAEQHALEEHEKLKEQLRQLQLAVMPPSAPHQKARHHRRGRMREPSLLERGSWLAPPMLRWRAHRAPFPQEQLLEDVNVPEEQNTFPDEQVQEDDAVEEETAIQAQERLEDAISDSNYQ